MEGPLVCTNVPLTFYKWVCSIEMYTNVAIEFGSTICYEATKKTLWHPSNVSMCAIQLDRHREWVTLPHLPVYFSIWYENPSDRCLLLYWLQMTIMLLSIPILPLYGFSHLSAIQGCVIKELASHPRTPSTDASMCAQKAQWKAASEFFLPQLKEHKASTLHSGLWPALASVSATHTSNNATVWDCHTPLILKQISN